jgi:hypothetical protein
MIRALVSLILWRILGAKVMIALGLLRWLRGRRPSGRPR